MSGALYFQQNRVTDTNDDPVSGAKAYFFDTGTSTPQTVYADAALTTPHPVPLVADSSGVFPAVFAVGTPQVKVDITDADDVQLPGYPIDPAVLQSAQANASEVSFTPTARISSTNVQDAIEEVDGNLELAEEQRERDHTVYLTAGAPSTYTITADDVASYSATDTYMLEIHASSTGATTLNVNAIGQKNVQKYDGTNTLVDLVADDFQQGEIHRVYYDGTQFVVLTPVKANETIKGIVEKSTSAENTGGTAVDKFPDVAGVKEMINEFVEVYKSGQVAFTQPGQTTFTHGLSAIPDMVSLHFVCVNASGGYLAGDEIIITDREKDSSTDKSYSVSADGTSIYASIIDMTQVANKPGTNNFSISSADWEIRAVAVVYK